jgi:hypothetical protein
MSEEMKGNWGEDGEGLKGLSPIVHTVSCVYGHGSKELTNQLKIAGHG